MSLLDFFQSKLNSGAVPAQHLHLPREVLYLDARRLRSLLAHLDRGVVDAVVQRHGSGRRGRAGMPALGSIDISYDSASEETRSLEDALFLLFEEAAADAGLIYAPEPWEWASRGLLDELTEGQIIRLTGPTRIVDSHHVHARTDRIIALAEVSARLSLSEQLAGLGQKDQDRLIRHALKEMFEGTSRDTIRNLGEFMELFMAGQIFVRTFPALEDDPDLAVVGPMTPGHLQDDREAISFKYGSGESEWTVLGQIATLPRPPGDGRADLDDLIEGLDQEDEVVNRAAFEAVAAGVMEMLESFGLLGAPQYPAISITPLAVYRDVPLAGSVAPSVRTSAGAKYEITETTSHSAA